MKEQEHSGMAGAAKGGDTSVKKSTATQALPGIDLDQLTRYEPTDGSEGPFMYANPSGEWLMRSEVVALIAQARAAQAAATLTAAQITAGAAVLGDDGKPIGRNTAIMVADAMGVAAQGAAPVVRVARVAVPDEPHFANGGREPDWAAYAKAEHEANIVEMVNRFLAWPIPATLAANMHPAIVRPVGTHLMNADEAKAMFEYCLQGATATAATTSEDARDAALRTAKWRFENIMERTASGPSRTDAAAGIEAIDSAMRATQQEGE